MAWTDTETQRIEAIEEMLNTLQIAIRNLASKLQVEQLMLIKQTEIDSIKDRVISLESQVTALQSRIA